MTNSSHRLRIATRESKLALWQANHVKELLERHHPDLTVVLVPMTTRGDQVLDRTLSKVGGKGLFIRELEQALLDDRADVAVHSLKDVPMSFSPAFQLGAMLVRENPLDAFVSNDYQSLGSLPVGAQVGTASLRRSAMLRAHYPNLEVVMLRGNLETRLRKLDEGQFSAIILACAGLIRMGYEHRIREMLAVQKFLPSPGQGTVGIELRANDAPTLARITPLISPLSTLQCTAERAFAEKLQGGCEVPLAAHAVFHQGELILNGWVAEVDGSRAIVGSDRATISPQASLDDTLPHAEALGRRLADQFVLQGALTLIERIRRQC